MEKKFIVPEAVLNAVLNYLANQKYVDVFQLVTDLQTKIEEVKPELPVE